MDVVKKNGRIETWSDRKAYEGSYRACLNAHLDKATSKKIATAVFKQLKAAVHGKKQVRSDFLFQLSIKFLKKHHVDAAFLFETHRDLS